jgi:glutamate/tyrosine decarboxylase-like PLP-dependent enzyme
MRDELGLAAVNEHVDAICTNFHKWGLVAFDCSTLWVRDRRVLTNALDVTPAFLRTKHGDAGLVVDYRNWSLSVSASSLSFINGNLRSCFDSLADDSGRSNFGLFCGVME